jgi:hypothetical protein
VGAPCLTRATADGFLSSLLNGGQHLLAEIYPACREPFSPRARHTCISGPHGAAHAKKGNQTMTRTYFMTADNVCRPRQTISTTACKIGDMAFGVFALGLAAAVLGGPFVLVLFAPLMIAL